MHTPISDLIIEMIVWLKSQEIVCTILTVICAVGIVASFFLWIAIAGIWG